MANYSRFFEEPEKLFTVLCFDPGETTGFCVMGVERDWLFDTTSRPENLKHIEYGQIDCRTGSSRLVDYEAAVYQHAGISLIGEFLGIEDMVELAVKDYPRSAIVLEDFVVDMDRIDQARHTLSPVRMISAFAYGIGIANLNRVHIQNRSLHKTTCNDDRLKNWGLYDIHSGDHARDATRVAYYFLRTCRGNTKSAAEKRWRAWPWAFDDPEDRTKRVQRQSRKKIGTRIESIK